MHESVVPRPSSQVGFTTVSSTLYPDLTCRVMKDTGNPMRGCWVIIRPTGALPGSAFRDRSAKIRLFRRRAAAVAHF